MPDKLKPCPLSKDEIITELQKGGGIYYFYLDGGVCLLTGESEKHSIAITDFLELREADKIKKTGNIRNAMPLMFAHGKCEIYSINETPTPE